MLDFGVCHIVPPSPIVEGPGELFNPRSHANVPSFTVATMKDVDPLSFRDARELILRTVTAAPAVETVSFECAAGRVLAEDVAADRDTPALARSVRDGFAIRATD